MPTLAESLRAKYPGAYDDLSDWQLEKSVVAKYPEYKDLATPVPETKQATIKDPVLDMQAAGEGLMPLGAMGAAAKFAGGAIRTLGAGGAAGAATDLIGVLSPRAAHMGRLLTRGAQAISRGAQPVAAAAEPVVEEAAAGGVSPWTRAFLRPKR